MATVEVPWELFESLLEARRAEFCPDGIPDCVWDYYINKIKDNYGCTNPKNNDPKVIVDNMHINSSWGFFSEYRTALESQQEFELRMLVQGAEKICPEDSIVIWSSPVMDNIIYER